MKEQFELKQNQTNTAKELADVAVGAGLVVAGPELAKFALEETGGALGADVSFLPKSEFIQNAFEVGVDTVQGLTGIAVAGMILYIGAKKMFQPLMSAEN